MRPHSLLSAAWWMAVGSLLSRDLACPPLSRGPAPLRSPPAPASGLAGSRTNRSGIWGSEDSSGVRGVRGYLGGHEVGGQAGQACALLRGCRVGWRGWLGGQPWATFCPSPPSDLRDSVLS